MDNPVTAPTTDQTEQIIMDALTEVRAAAERYAEANARMEEEGTDQAPLSAEESQILEDAVQEAHEEDENRTILPSNSPTLLIDESSSRFSSAEWFEEIKKQTVTLAGLGGIGSYVAFLMSRFKVSRLVVYDDDMVEEVNLSGQLFGRSDIGTSKVDAVIKMNRNYSGDYATLGFNEKFDRTSPTTDIMVCGFDNMAARRTFFQRWVYHVMSKPEEERADCLFIDGRLAAEEFQVFCIKGTDSFLMEKYERDWLFTDSQAEQTLCSYKQTTFCANMIASVMANLFVNFIANKCNPLIERELPFFTHYDAERMILKTEMV